MSINSAAADQVTRVLQQRSDIRLAILFGSVAQGTARPDSDLDLAIAGTPRLDATARLGLLTELAEIIGRPIDLIDLDLAGEPLLGCILLGGKRLLGSDEEYAALIRRHVFDRTDFLPYRERLLEERAKQWISA